MDGKEFLEASKEISRYIVEYHDNIRERRVLPDVGPGYLSPLLPKSAPEQSEDWQDILRDVERIIMPGVTHWQSPQFHAYFPAASCYPSILADMICGAIACVGFTWIASPACTELEVVMMDWLGEMIGLPKDFMAREEGPGGGVIQGTASEATLVALLSAKKKKTKSITNPCSSFDTLSLIAYTSDQSHSSVERAALLAGVKIRLLPSNQDNVITGATLKLAIKEDLERGYTPFFVAATVGTTNSCAFDPIREIAEVANEFDLWTHVDAAYAGAAFVCPEFRKWLDGVELVNSFNFNPHKWLLVNFDCSAMWVKNSNDLVDAFNVDPLYLRHDHQGVVPDYRHWQIPLGRRFRSLKLWFVMRIYGKLGLQEHIRKQVNLAKEFEDFVRSDSRFEIFSANLGLVCFRLKGTNSQNQLLLKMLNDNGVIHLVPGQVRDTYFLRFAICSRFTESHDILLAWNEIKKMTSKSLWTKLT